MMGFDLETALAKIQKFQYLNVVTFLLVCLCVFLLVVKH